MLKWSDEGLTEDFIGKVGVNAYDKMWKGAGGTVRFLEELTYWCEDSNSNKRKNKGSNGSEWKGKVPFNSGNSEVMASSGKDWLWCMQAWRQKLEMDILGTRISISILGFLNNKG